MIKIKCDTNKPPMKVKTCGAWNVLAEEAANIVKGLTISLLKQLSPPAHRVAADILKEAYAVGYREGLKQIREKEGKKSEAAD